MKQTFSLLTVLILVFSSVQFSFGSPLVFKIVKEIKNGDERKFIELTSLDTSKYKQIRIGVVLSAGNVSQFGNLIQIDAAEDNEFIFLRAFEVTKNASITLDSPPTKIRISVKESGTYKVFVWASL